MNLTKAYEVVRKRDKRVNSYFKNPPKSLLEVFEEILKELGLEVNEDNLFALKKRVFHLREDALFNLLKDFDKEKIRSVQLRLYEITKDFWLNEHKKLIDEISFFISPFYIELLKGVHKIGIAFSKWQPAWMSHIIYTINEELSLEFGGDEAKVMAFFDGERID
jgi:hypothetical protein